MIDVKSIAEFLDSPIAFNRTFAQVANNSLTAGILLSQLFYWAKICNFEEFSKTNEELQEECFLSRRKFDSARKILVDLRIISITKKCIPAKIYYRLNMEQILILLKRKTIK